MIQTSELLDVDKSFIIQNGIMSHIGMCGKLSRYL